MTAQLSWTGVDANKQNPAASLDHRTRAVSWSFDTADSFRFEPPVLANVPVVFRLRMRRATTTQRNHSAMVISSPWHEHAEASRAQCFADLRCVVVVGIHTFDSSRKRDWTRLVAVFAGSTGFRSTAPGWQGATSIITENRIRYPTMALILPAILHISTASRLEYLFSSGAVRWSRIT